MEETVRKELGGGVFRRGGIAVAVFVALEILILMSYLFLADGPKLIFLALSIPVAVCLVLVSIMLPGVVVACAVVTMGFLFPISIGSSARNLSIYVGDVLIITATVGLLVRKMVEGRLDFRAGPLEVSLLFFYLFMVASIIADGDILYSLDRIIKWGLVFLFFWTATEAASRLKDPVTLLYAVPAFGLVTSLQFIVSVLRMNLSLVEIAGGRGALGFAWARSNYLAAIFAIALIVTIALLLKRKAGGRSFLLASVILMVIALVLTTSRGGLVTFGVGVAFLMLMAGRRGVLFLALMLPVAFAVGQTLVFKYTMLRFMNLTESFSVKARFSAWRDALENFRLHPVLGTGFSMGRDPHNLPLKIASEMGVVGLVAGAVLVGAVLVTIVRARRAFADRKILYHGVAAMVLTAGVNCLFEPTFSGPHYSILFWFVMAVVSVSGSTIKEKA